MILDKNVQIKIAKYNINHYLNFFPDIKLKDIIEIDVEKHLQKGSNMKINVQCDLCDEKRYIKYQAYIFNVNSCVEYPIYTCDKCSHIKIKEYNKKKYGVEYYSQHPDRNEKVRKTSIDKYGVDHYSKTKEYLDSRSKTNLEKYGYENPFMDKEKIKKSLLEKYNVINPSQIKESVSKAKTSTRITNERTGYWIPIDQKSDWIIYKQKCRRLTRNNIKLLDWDGHDYYDNEYIKDNFDLHYFDNNYPTIDHKISIYDGFTCGIRAEDISNVNNLCWTKRILNISKNKKSYLK